MCRLLLLCIAGCAAPAFSSPRAVRPAACPRGADVVDDRDSDVRWAETEHLVGCQRDGLLEGWAREELAATGTVLEGRYAPGMRVGTWTQYDARTSRALVTFTFDADGSGVEHVDGHALRGAVVRGQRDGVWTFSDRDGVVVASESWSHGTYAGRSGEVPWDPPMLEPSDRCGDAGEDGC